MISRPSPRRLTAPRVTVPTMVQPMGGVTFTALPNILTFCGATQRGSRRLMVHNMRGTACSIASRRALASASTGTAIRDFSCGAGTGSVARGGATSAGFCWHAAQRMSVRRTGAVLCKARNVA